MNKEELTPEQLKNVRLAIALSICNKYPKLFEKLYSNKGYVMGEQETLASGVLKALLKLEPSVKTALEYYYNITL